MKRLDLDLLRTFATVVERGSFTAAAERMGLTQPAISLQIRQLEKRLGTALIERVGRRARPTTAGAELLAHAPRIETAVDDALDAVARHGQGTMGRVRIGTGATACIFLLPPLLGALRRKFPSLEITVATGNAADIVKAVEDNLLDIALTTLPVAGRMLDIVPVLKDEIVAAAPKGFPLPARASASALAKLPMLLYEPGGNTRRLIDTWFAREKVKFEPVLSLGSTEAIKAMALEGLGCAVLPAMSLRVSRAGEFVTRPLSPRLSRTLAVVMRRDKRLSRGLKAVRDALLDLRMNPGKSAPK
ncbi:MAG: LysR family transcriptional regulator [Tagaea sp. CACIAM 22H2]|nr:LysR family transcriptional regulator [Tagaea sp. CACIAM 22H2]